MSNTPPSTNKKNNAGLIAGIIVPIAVVGFLALLALYIICQRRKKQDTFDDYEGNNFRSFLIKEKVLEVIRPCCYMQYWALSVNFF